VLSSGPDLRGGRGHPEPSPSLECFVENSRKNVQLMRTIEVLRVASHKKWTVGTARIVREAWFKTKQCPSIFPSWVHTSKPATAGLLLWAQQKEIPINFCRIGVNADSAKLSAHVEHRLFLKQPVVLSLCNLRISVKQHRMNKCQSSVLFAIYLSIQLSTKHCS